MSKQWHEKAKAFGPALLLGVFLLAGIPAVFGSFSLRGAADGLSVTGKTDVNSWLAQLAPTRKPAQKQVAQAPVHAEPPAMRLPETPLEQPDSLAPLQFDEPLLEPYDEARCQQNSADSVVTGRVRRLEINSIDIATCRFAIYPPGCDGLVQAYLEFERSVPGENNTATYQSALKRLELICNAAERAMLNGSTVTVTGERLEEAGREYIRLNRFFVEGKS